MNFNEFQRMFISPEQWFIDSHNLLTAQTSILIEVCVNGNFNSCKETTHPAFAYENNAIHYNKDLYIYAYIYMYVCVCV